ncbi:MAG TPA: serine/threonine-protein kinase [Gemmataceae bacterium]|nr:serine/threonine-protein kinase [Gemmataceae bacterium]
MHNGQKVGPFQIESEIGSGAMGQVYLARYIKNGQKVAIKVIATGLRNATAQARFQREAEVLKQLNHPNIVRFYVVSEFEGAPYYAMEFVEGEPLDSLLERRGKLPWDDVVEIGKQICAALQHAHQQGIIHRDLKPSNLMIMKDGTVKLTDFGIAKDLDVAQLTATNNTVGTAAYMSPEQCRGERNLTHKSDLYSLGVVLYELLVGTKPFEAETTMDLFLAHVQGSFERPSRKVLDIPVWLDTLVCQLMEKRPDQRPLDAAIVSEALLQVAEKIQAQSSAGVDAARSRLADRNLRRSGPDTEDRKAARTLLETSKRKKRRKSQKKRVFEEAWFQAIGLASLLAIVATLVYVAFRAPSEKKLFEQVLKSVEAEDTQAEIRAIKEFKRYYPDSTTPEAEQVRRLAGEMDMKQREKSLLKRRKTISADNDAETAAREAFGFEEKADFVHAAESWQKVLKANGVSIPDSLVANWHIQDIAKSEEEESKIVDQLKKARNGDPFPAPNNDTQRSALAAERYEMIGDWAQALASWQQILRENNQDADIPDTMRPWIILAKRKAREIKPKLPDPPSEIEEKKARLKVLDDKLAEAITVGKDFPGEASYLCKNILDLYAKDKDPDVVQKLAQFQKLLDTLPKSGKG